MKTTEVPEDGNRTLAGQRKAVYARDAAGRYTVVPSCGWSVEETVTQLAVDAFREQAAEALQAARAGLLSPLAYHMYARRMDAPTLAQAAGVWRWRVRRHLRVRSLGRLSEGLKQRYADALGLPLEGLAELPDE